jgi:hypothetical protein
MYAALLLLVACGGPPPAAPEPPPNEPGPLSVVEAGPPPAPKAAPEPMGALDVGCPSKLVGYYKEVLARGCKLDDVDNALAIAPKVLRNVAYAGRGHTFKSKDLTAFYTNDRQGCEAAWYKPAGFKVELEGEELECVGKLKKLEDKARKKTGVPKQLDTIMLEQMGTDVVSEVGRQLGHGKDYSVSIRRTDDNGWRVSFDYESEQDGEIFESASIITCDSAGENCETFFAG